MRVFWIMAFTSFGLALVGGCLKPVASTAPTTTTKSAKSAPPSAIESDPDGTTPVDRLQVNAKSITAEDIWQRDLDELRKAATTKSPDQFRSFLVQHSANIIRDRIAETLLAQESELRLPAQANKQVDDFVATELRKIVTTRYDGRQRRYEKELESQGRSLDDVRADLRRDIMIGNYLDQEVKAKIDEPTRAELMAAYAEISGSLRRPPRRRMSLIDVRWSTHASTVTATSTSPQPDGPRQAARTKVQEAMSKLHSGENFATVATRFSDGLHASEGGSWGWVTKGSVRERFDPAVEHLYTLGAGEVSQVIETDGGYFIVRCDEIDAGHEPDFESSQPQLKARYYSDQSNRQVAELVEKLRKKARIIPKNLERFHRAVVDAGQRLAEEVGP